MGLLVRFLVSFAFFVPLTVLAQTFQYKLEGSYSVETLETSGGNSPISLAPIIPNTIPAPPPAASSVTINFTLRWNESSNLVQGLYQDNYFSSSPTVVSGNVMNTGRTFTIILPQLINNTKSIAIRTDQVGVANGSVQTTIRTMNNVGGVLNSISSYGYMTSISQLASETPSSSSSCSVGFGALAGYCGVYGGSVTEISDANNRCDLLQNDTPRLELATDTQFNLLLDPTKVHRLGTFVASPDGYSISLSRRHCGALENTTFPAANCKILNLNASFFNQAGNYTASGNYTITDELTGEACSYNMFLTRQTAY